MRRRAQVVACLALLLGAGERHGEAARTPGWTVLLYVNADNDLQGEAVGVIEALTTIGGTADVEVLALIDQGPQPQRVANLAGETWTGGKLVRVEWNRLEELASWPAEPLMGRPETVADFLRFGLARAARERVCLWVMGHGAMWAGTGPDETNELGKSVDDWLLYTELARGIQDGLRGQRDRLDMLVLSVCNSSALEVAHALEPVADYLVASESLTSYRSFPLSSTLEMLARAPGTSARDLGLDLVRRYRAPFARDCLADRSPPAYDATLLDLSHVKGVLRLLTTLVASLASEITNGGIAASDVLALRHSSRPFGCLTYVIGPLCLDAEKGCCQRDLVQLVRGLAAWRTTAGLSSAHVRIGSEAQGVLDALEGDLIACHSSGPRFPPTGGVSLYFPCRAEDLTAYATLPFAAETGWGALALTLAAGGCDVTSAVKPQSVTFGQAEDPSRLAVTLVLDAGTGAVSNAWVSVAVPGAPASLLLLPPRNLAALSAGSVRRFWDRRIAVLEGPGGGIPLLVGPAQLHDGSGLEGWCAAGRALLRPASAPAGAPLKDVTVFVELREGTDARLDAEVVHNSPTKGTFVSRLNVGDELVLDPALRAWWGALGNSALGVRLTTDRPRVSSALLPKLPQGADLRVGVGLRDSRGIVLHRDATTLFPGR